MNSHRRAHRTRKILALAVIVGLSLAVWMVSSSAGSPSQTPSISLIRYGALGVAASVDNARPSGNTAQVEELGVETLMKIAPDGSVRPHLASSVKHPNPITYIYTIRKGVRFWNGNELTAQDAAHALNYYRYKGFVTSQIGAFPVVREIKATGKYTLRVTLKRPDARWPFTPATQTFIFEKKFQDEHGADMGKPGTLIMGTGPFIIDKVDPTSGVELSANPRYWGGRVAIRRLSYKFFTDPTAMALAFRAGDLDVAAVADARGFQATSGKSVTSADSCNMFWLALNTKTRPWSDVHVRRAVAYAINRPNLIAAAGGPGAAYPINTILHPTLLSAVNGKAAADKLVKSLNLYPYNLAKARAELAKSSTPNGFRGTIDAITVSTLPAVMQAIASNLSRIGINVQVNPLPPTAWVAKGAGPHDQLSPWLSGIGCTSPYAGGLIGIILNSKNAVTGKSNYADFTNPRVDAALEVAQRSSDSAKQFAAYATILKIHSNQVPYVPLYSPRVGYAFSTEYKFPKLNPFALASGPDAAFYRQVRPG